MIFIEKKGRFGNFLFQYLVGKIIQQKYNQKIIIFSKNENKYFFYSKKNIDRLIGNEIFLPKITKFLNILQKFCININDDNYKFFFDKNENYRKKNFFISGFFQDIDLLNHNIEILNNLIKYKKLLPKEKFENYDLTIHLRHLYKNKNIDDNEMYKNQPNIFFYKKIIEQENPKNIKIVCSNKNNEILLNLKKIYTNKINFIESDDVSDFTSLLYSKKIILSLSTFSLWSAILSKAEKVYVPNSGILKKILKRKILDINSKFYYIDY